MNAALTFISIQVKPKALPVGSPGLKEIVFSVQAGKRKISENGSSAKKAKKVNISF